ncbi:Predicted signal-transduction protein containing cAMP-binding and CBS domains [hydrothermal vent metagenome]|uniref:Predicted signal-transduction protein containing cAMP-binding and CBS domains n=1 Tax=hydrothermal vent metagenome TaxID=652676 RepID=A0A1W1ECY8_9ZZZZ
MIALLDNLKSHLPFSLLNESTLQKIEDSAHIAYYQIGTVLIPTGESPKNIFVIIKGVVESKVEDELIDVYYDNDLFGAIEVVKGITSTEEYVVAEELICYEIPIDLFLEIANTNKEFNSYLFSSIMERMDMLKENNEFSKAADLMVSRADDSILRTVCIVDADTPIVQALAKLEDAKATTLIVNNEYGYGIVTDADLRYYILHKDEDDLRKISQLQSYPIVTVDEDELLFNVLLVMTEHSIKHLPVIDDKNNIVGSLVLTDLLSYLSNQTHLIAVQMNRAETIEEIIQASSRIEIMVSVLHGKGVKSRYIARMVSEVHKKMYAKIFTLVFPKEWHNRCTLLLLGSEGRGEQILRTDQDNAIVFENGFSPENKDEVLLSFIETLDKIGFPRCPGNVMVINPEWAKDVKTYKNDISSWVNNSGKKGIVNMAILYDTFAVAGNIDLYKEIRSHMLKKIKEHKEYLSYFAKSIVSFESPLGMFSQFITDKKLHKDEIDIKKGALFAIIHGVRALSLEYGIQKTNTNERIKELSEKKYMSKEDAKDLIETLELINTLRLHSQLAKLKMEKDIDNYICVTSLTKLERDTLKEALKTVEQFKKRVSYHFNLSIVS